MMLFSHVRFAGLGLTLAGLATLIISAAMRTVPGAHTAHVLFSGGLTIIAIAFYESRLQEKEYSQAAKRALTFATAILTAAAIYILTGIVYDFATHDFAHLL